MNLVAVTDWSGIGLGLGLGAVAGASLGFWLLQRHTRKVRRDQAAAAESSRQQAETTTREARLAAQEELVRSRQELEASFTARQRSLDDQQQRLAEREQLVNQQLTGLVEREKGLREQLIELQRLQANTTQRQLELDGLLRDHRQQLQQLAHLSEADARAALLKQVESDALKDATDLSRHILENAKARADDEARRIVGMAIQRYAGDHSFETTTATVALNSDELKGRIIGREGRNIRAFEQVTGVTVLIDDTPNAVVLSGFDPVRREIARQAMERLVADGRIHPTRIEEVVTKVREEMDDTIVKAGEEAVFKLGLPPLHLELLKVLGRLRFRYSFSQNILDHSIEVAHLAGLMAAEMQIDVGLAKRAGLLHDIGKALNHEVEGCHAQIGADLIRRHGEPAEVVDAVAAHHDQAPQSSLLGIILVAADAISASRPGARSESMTTYLRRLENLEQIGGGFTGVEKCYAVQAGRELRVIVHPSQVGDEQAHSLARSIARKIEDDLQYPGQIRVTVLRETRCVEYAK